jgi:hypothetical protein
MLRRLRFSKFSPRSALVIFLATISKFIASGVAVA